MRFFVPGRDFSGLTKITPEGDYGFPDVDIYSATIIGRIGRLISPNIMQNDIRQLLSRISHSNPNVMGPIGISCNIPISEQEILPLALLFGPMTAKPITIFSFIQNGDTDLVHLNRVFKFSLGIAQGLTHLHESSIVHGNVCLSTMRIDGDGMGLIVTGIGKLVPLAPESLANKEFTPASDMFQFGVVMGELLLRKPYQEWRRGKLVQEPPDISEVMAKFKALTKNQDSDHIKRDAAHEYLVFIAHLFCSCFNVDPDKRPTAYQCVEVFEFLASKEKDRVLQKLWLDISMLNEIAIKKEELCPGGIFEYLYSDKILDAILETYDSQSGKAQILSNLS